MVALTMKTPMPGTLAFRFNTLPHRVERRRMETTDLTLYNEKGRAVGQVRAVYGEPEFGPEAPELLLNRGV